MRKRLILPVFIIQLLFVFFIPLTLYADVATEGYPYDNYAKYSYHVENEGRFTLDDQGATKIMTFGVTVRDAKTKALLSNDKLEVTLRNVPTDKYTIARKDDSAPALRRESGYSVTHSFAYRALALQDWDNFVKSIKPPEGAVLRQGSFMGRKAVFVDEKETLSMNTGVRSRGAGGTVYVSFNDIPLPNGQLIGTFIWRAAANYFVGQQFIDEKRVAEADMYFEEAVAAAKKRLDEYNGVTVSVVKHASVIANQSKPISVTVDTTASSKAGETSRSVEAAIVVGLAGVAAAAAGAGAAGAAGASAGGTDSGTDSGSTYKMLIYKDFGDKIRIGDRPVYIQARMMEVTPEGAEVERPDLTQKIEIFSPDGVLTVGGAALRGTSMRSSVEIPKLTAAGRAAVSKTKAQPTEGVVSFRFTGEGGTFQNNVKFRIIGESQIKLAADKFPILATSAGSFELGYELIDFVSEPKVELVYKSDLFELELGKNKKGRDVIIAKPAEKAAKMNFQRFIHRYPCEITAKNDKETTSAKFELHLCYEGIGTAYQDCKNSGSAEEFVLHCFSDSEKDKREDKAFRLPLAVMRWDDAAQKLEPDENLAKDLILEFHPDTRSKNLPVAEAVKAVKDAAIKAKVDTNPGTVKTDAQMKPAIYMIYPEKSALAGAPEIELLVTVSVANTEFENLTLTAKLKPQVDFKGMIKWFIEYPQGTFVDKYIKIGDVDTYHGALDFIENRVYAEKTCSYTPKKGDGGKLENHYEDGYLDVSRPTYVFLLNDSMPHQIGEFKKIQSLHHELAHAIEHQHGDFGVKDNSERHAWFIQHLAEVVHTLADMERGKRDVALAGKDAIQAYYNVFYDENNAAPQTFSWFGVKYLTAHQMFERYAEFDIYSDSNIPDAKKQEIAQFFKEHYFPGNLEGKRFHSIAKFRETKGIFQNAIWTIECSTIYIGLFNKITIEHPGYEFTTRKNPQWVPGTLKIKATYDVKSVSTGNTETLEVELDGGNFDPGDYRYPKIDKFTVTWQSADRINDGMLGQHTVISEAVKA